MTKNEWIAMMEYFRAHALNCHVPPTKGIDSGTAGKAAEMEVNNFFGNCRGHFIKPPKTPDARKKISGQFFTFEVKTGNGTVSSTVDKGLQAQNYFTTDYVIYIPYYFPDVAIDLQAFIVSGDQFCDLVNAVRGLRYAKSKSGAKKIMFTSNFSDRFLRHADGYISLREWYNQL